MIKLALIIWGIAGIMAIVYASWQFFLVGAANLLDDIANDKHDSHWKDYIKPMLLMLAGIASVVASVWLYVR